MTQLSKVTSPYASFIRGSNTHLEEYRRTIMVDGELSSVGGYNSIPLSPKEHRICRRGRAVLLSVLHPPCISRVLHLLIILFLHYQLEVLDTAGAEQFTSLNEVYIKVNFSPSPLNWVVLTALHLS